MNRIILFCALLTVFLFSRSAAQVPAGKGTDVPRFEKSDCAVPVPKQETHVVCGYLIVPENRAAKNGRTIRLPIVILKSENPDPKPDPVLKTLGGPGGSSLKMIRGRRASPWLKDRDYIIFEQRGTRYAQPALDCPEVDEANIASAKKQLDRSSSRAAEVAAAQRCYQRLVGSGIDLNAYNSAESAADIADLRRALHLEKINLYGVSYSARLMLDVMRYFPDGIRSVVLESTLPPEVNYDEVGVDAVLRSLDVMFNACRADRDCAAAYPNLENEFYTVVAKLNAQPLTVPSKAQGPEVSVDLQLDGFDFLNWILDYLFSNEPSATVDAPYLIHQAFHGNYVAQFKSYAGDKLNGSFYSWGMRYSVWCSEEMPFERMSAIKAQSNKYPRIKGFEVMALPDICSVWKVKPAKPVASQPVTSNIPTLVLAAQYDAYTAPDWGRQTAGRMKNSFFFEVPWAGHGPAFSVPCVSGMIAEFIDQPMAAPASDCIEATRKQFKFTVKSPTQ